MAALALPADLEVRLGSSPLTGTDLARAQANLDDVSVLVRAEGDKTWGTTVTKTDPVTKVTTSTPIPVPDEARLVTIQAALRAYRNPDGFVGENIGGAYSYTFGPGAQNGVYLNADEVRIVRIAAGLNPNGGPRGYLGSVHTPAATDYTPTEPVVYVGGAGEPLPLYQGELLIGAPGVWRPYP